MAIGPCQPDAASCLNGPPCRLCCARAWPPAQGTARGPLGRAESTAYRRTEHAHVGKRQPWEVAVAVGVLDVAAAALASAEEDEVAAALDLQPAIAGRRRR